ncbi:RNA polymerase sigma factor [Leptospira licerasiae]|uniref:Sigma-70, region 4 n=1 Tax=Leptospira licerasiae str. MMD4847 TaxID=1049971 RepID=A0ABN0H510_9LEPT|nr:RNA polymerase sigma factor [Leptospira licerasiae]EIE02360.1 RNA polymerase sigma factor, sigma-70 family [Leptospira licerasiae serovar Varillal str. VAR 010]EJZ40399.1 sigma-70, region 4 [Leptospira licerasiae str. MMD4847]
MTEPELIRIIESSKETVLKSIRRHILPGMASLVEDLVQDTYLRYYLKFKNKPSLNLQDANRWLYVAARNECRRAIRKWNREGRAYSKLQTEIKVSEKKEPDMAAIEPDPDQRKWMESQINLLPSPYKETMILRLDGEKMESIAKKLDISEGTVKSRISRAKEWLSRFANSNRKGREDK